MDERKECPYCGEEIAASAKKCRFCGEWLEEEVVQDAIAPQPADGATEIQQPAAPTALAAPTEPTVSKTFSPGMINFLVYASLLGMLPDLFEYIKPDWETFNNVTGIIGTLITGGGICALLFMLADKLSADGIKGVSPSMTKATAVIYAISSIASCFDSGIMAVVICLPCLICLLIFWIIVSVQLIKVPTLNKMGIWMLAAILVSAAVLALVDYLSLEFESKRMIMVIMILYIGGYAKFFDYLKKYLTNSNNGIL